MNFNFAEVQTRFCLLFSREFRHIAQMLDTADYLEALCRYNVDSQNFQRLLTDVHYTNEDTYCAYMEVVVGASNALQRFMAGNISFLEFLQDLFYLN